MWILPPQTNGEEEGKVSETAEHQHCWHAHRGPLWMVLKDGQVVQVCCKCDKHRTIHADHTLESR